MAITARKDWDRLTNAVATGNVVTGVNTLSGNTGKDVAGVAPNKVTKIQSGGTTLAVPAAGVDIFGDNGILHINPDGSYTYTRLQVEVVDVPAGATDVFTYTYADKNGATSTATLTIEVLPETVAVADSKGVHKGTAFDDFIDGSDYQLYPTSGIMTIDGGGGQDKVVGSDQNASHLFGGAGNDWLIGDFGGDLFEGGAGADRIEGGGSTDTAIYTSSKSAVTVDLTNNANNHGGDAEGDLLFDIDNLIGSAFNDTLKGDSDNNKLEGGKGNDTLISGDGDDELFGQAGNDSLFGGLNLDTPRRRRGRRHA
ncbi:MAG: hypothetical protein HC869_24585 [Rhodospirillales bacterium]|nr:hypothetical protein [Rhodospirillales bacterium]